LIIPSDFTDSKARDINDIGQIAGEVYTKGVAHATVWQPNQGTETWKTTQLGGLPGLSHSYATAINNRGQVVGIATRGSVVPGLNDLSIQDAGGRAFLWQEGRMVDLNSLISPGCGWELRYAHDINDAGQIVGRGGFRDSRNSHDFAVPQYCGPW
jgi:probable HAF family extracellular repeat protein